MGSTREKLLGQFRALVVERLSRISGSLMELEGGPSPDAGRRALRELHGLKGEARMMGFADVNNVVHEMEDLVRSAEPRGFALTGGSTDALLSASDAVTALAGAAEASGTPPEVAKLVAWLKSRTAAEQQLTTGGQPAPAAGPEQAKRPATPTDKAASPPEAAAAGQGGSTARPGSPPVPEVSRETRSESRRLDGAVRIGQKTLDLLTSATSNLGQLFRRRELSQQKRFALARELALLARAAEDLGPAAASIATRLGQAKELAAELHREGKLLANAELRELTHLSEEVQALRMLPLKTLFEAYPRMVRDLARTLEKSVDLKLEGEQTEADRAVVEALQEPLMHLVRNALDHGVETPEERVRAGKPAKATLTLQAIREGERVLLRVRDDGRGIDPAALRRAAVAKGLMDQAEAAALTEAAARDLIFIPGFSSKETVTDISGRGVGLDVVRVRLQGLGGDVALHSEVGRGTTFELRVPVSLTVAPLLFIQVGEERLCLTAAHVDHALHVAEDQVRELAGRPAVRVLDEVLPFASIASILGLAPPRPPSTGELVLLLRGHSGTAAISVDRVLDQRVQAVMPLKGFLGSYPHLSGATALADGSLALVLSASYLIASAQGTATRRVVAGQAEAPKVRARRILVVDDSPLTRELISSLLESVGYQIVNAGDGTEALERLGKEAVDMVVTDLEMPRMDGLELTRRLKSHPTLRSLPVVIVTTRGGDSDRRRGMEAGADGYIAKGDLVRQDLVDVVSRLLA